MKNYVSEKREWKRSSVCVWQQVRCKMSSVPSSIDGDHLNNEDTLTSSLLSCGLEFTTCSWFHTLTLNTSTNTTRMYTHTHRLYTHIQYGLTFNKTHYVLFSQKNEDTHTMTKRHKVYKLPTYSAPVGTWADEVSYCQRRGECGGGLCQRAGAGHYSVWSTLPVWGDCQEEQGTGRAVVPQKSGWRNFYFFSMIIYFL